MKDHWFIRRLGTLWFTLVVIAVSLIVREYYPLSRFPMYAHFDSKSHYLFMTDEHGEPVVDMKHQFMQTAIRMHKIHSTKVNQLKALPENQGRDTLDMMREAGPPLLEQMLEFQRVRWAKRKDHSDKRTYQRLDLWVEFLRLPNKEEQKTGGSRLIHEKYHLATWPPEAVGTPVPVASEKQQQQQPEAIATP